MARWLAASETDPSSILWFEEGIVGVPRARRFQLLERAGSAVRLLRCLDIEGFALPVVEPARADPDYRPRLGRRVREALGAEGNEPLVILVVTVLGPEGPRANLRAPIVIHPRTRRGVQVILEDPSLPLDAPVR